MHSLKVYTSLFLLYFLLNHWRNRCFVIQVCILEANFSVTILNFLILIMRIFLMKAHTLISFQIPINNVSWNGVVLPSTLRYDRGKDLLGPSRLWSPSQSILSFKEQMDLLWGCSKKGTEDRPVTGTLYKEIHLQAEVIQLSLASRDNVLR